jgi:hypothetical protein
VDAAVVDRADAAVEAFEAAVVEAKSDRVEDPVAVAADRARELDERLQPRSRGPGEPRGEVLRRERGVGQLVENAELFREQERAVQRLVRLLGLVQQRELSDRLLGGRLEQRPAGALDPLPRGGVGALVGVLFVAADLIDGALREPHDVERVKADLGVGEVLSDRLLVAAGHVDRDGAD